jgi:hypothetical protein
MTKVTKIALEERNRTAAIAEGRAARRLTSQWYKDPAGALLIRWVIEAEQEEHCSSDALAA